MKPGKHLRSATALIASVLALSSCSAPLSKKSKDLNVAVGYIEGQEFFSDEIRQIVTDYLPKDYDITFTMLRSEDINFSQKEVNWHMGIGGTIFALKEIGEGINFFPAMWERNCLKKAKFISKGKVADFSIKKFKKILVFHTDYPSPLSLTYLYPSSKDQMLFETSNPEKAIAALKNNKVDLIITETTALRSPVVTKNIDLLPINNQKFHFLDSDEKGIACRTLFFSPKASAEDQKRIVESLSHYPWESKNLKILPFHPVETAEFNRIQSLFDWKADEAVRTKLRPL